MVLVARNGFFADPRYLAGVGLVVQGSPLSPRLAFGGAPDVAVVVLMAVALVLARAAATLRWGRMVRR